MWKAFMRGVRQVLSLTVYERFLFASRVQQAHTEAAQQATERLDQKTEQLNQKEHRLDLIEAQIVVIQRDVSLPKEE